MRRREFVIFLGSAAITLPFATRAQQTTLPVVGFLSARSPNDAPETTVAFHKGLAEGGYVEKRNVTIDYRFAEGRYEQLEAAAADLIRREVSVVAAFSPPAALAVKAATSKIPIVFTSGDDPVRLGLVASLNRPGGNLTGVAFFSSVLGAKRLELLRMLVGKLNFAAVLVNPTIPDMDRQLADAEEAGRVLGVKLLVLKAQRESEIESIFATAAHQGVDALIVGADPFFSQHRYRFAVLAAQHRMPTIYVQRNYVEAGGLISYGASLEESYRQVGLYVARILKGEKPSDLPVLQPTKFDLIINLKTAEALGLSIPAQLLALADEVIE